MNATRTPASTARGPGPSRLQADRFDFRLPSRTQGASLQGGNPLDGLFQKMGQRLDDLATDVFGRAKHRDSLAERFFDRFHEPIPVSSNDDDPFAKEANIEGVRRLDFDLDKNGKPVGLSGNRAYILDEDKIYRQDPKTGNYAAFAWNPWSPAKPDANGRFVFDEPRFPPFQIERGPDGKPILRDGLQVWTPNNLKIGQATAFESMNSVSRAAESWAGREIRWGQDGKLMANTHAFVAFNAFYSPSAKGLFFGVVPYRLPGDPQVKMFETATSWEMTAHEAGHALQYALKPNVDKSDLGFRQWGESFSDQTAMWTSLRDRGRAEALLKEIDGDLNTSNSLTRMGEAFAALVGKGTGVRDALHDKKMSNTSPEVHDRSEVLTGASYKIFQAVYQDQLANGRSRLDALQVAGDVMGTLNLRTTEHTPEKSLSFEDVGKAWLKVDKEYFKGRYHDVIANELVRREVFDAGSVAEFEAHEKGIPKLSLSYDFLFTKLVHKNENDLNKLVSKNLDKLGIGPGYDLKVVGHELDDNGAQIVRVQLYQGKGKDAVPLDNHGVLTFRPDGTLRDWHNPLPQGVGTGDLAPVLKAAREAGLDTHGAPIGVKLGADGRLTAEAQMMVGEGLNAEVKAWSLDSPQGERRSLLDEHDLDGLLGALPKGAQILTPEEIANLTPADLAAANAPATGPTVEGTPSPFVAAPPPTEG